MAIFLHVDPMLCPCFGWPLIGTNNFSFAWSRTNQLACEDATSYELAKINLEILRLEKGQTRNSQAFWMWVAGSYQWDLGEIASRLRWFIIWMAHLQSECDTSQWQIRIDSANAINPCLRTDRTVALKEAMRNAELHFCFVLVIFTVGLFKLLSLQFCYGVTSKQLARESKGELRYPLRWNAHLLRQIELQRCCWVFLQPLETHARQNMVSHAGQTLWSQFMSKCIHLQMDKLQSECHCRLANFGSPLVLGKCTMPVKQALIHAHMKNVASIWIPLQNLSGGTWSRLATLRIQNNPARNKSKSQTCANILLIFEYDMFKSAWHTTQCVLPMPLESAFWWL